VLDDKLEWSESEKAFFVVGIPALALIAVLLVLSVATSERHDASAASAQPVSLSPEALAEQARHKAFEAARNTYLDCLEGMGVHVRGFLRSRFVSRDDLRTANSVCQAALGSRRTGPSLPRQAPVPNIL